MHGAPLFRRDAPDHVRAVLDRLRGVEGALLAREALTYHARVPVDPHFGRGRFAHAPPRGGVHGGGRRRRKAIETTTRTNYGGGGIDKRCHLFLSAMIIRDALLMCTVMYSRLSGSRRSRIEILYVCAPPLSQNRSRQGYFQIFRARHTLTKRACVQKSLLQNQGRVV